MPPDVFDLERFRPLYPIGRGGMGVVEVALEKTVDGSERVCALKRLLPEGARDKRHTDMFLREARLAALLSHPNVVHGFSFGEAGGELFLAMEYVEGEPLSRVLVALREANEKMAPALAAFLVAEMCDGLHAVHCLRDEDGTELRVIHRDVSPHNVMVAYEGGLKLLDFGVAKIEAEPGLTRTGEVKGKTAYMSPEQAMGEASLDHRSDLYSVGAVLFECVAGRKMWEGTEMEVLRHLALDEPPTLVSARADAPPELSALYTQLVAKRPEDRPASAQRIAEQLRAFAAASRSDGPSEARALMRRLFAAEESARKSELERALSTTAAPKAHALEAARSASSAPERASEGDLSASLKASAAKKDKSTVAWIGAAVLVAIGVTAMMLTRGSAERPAATAPTEPMTAATAPATTTTSSPATTTATATSAVPLAERAPTASTAAPSTPKMGAAKASAGPKNPPRLDVDTTPF